jgi:hypothetical protein
MLISSLLLFILSTYGKATITEEDDIHCTPSADAEEMKMKIEVSLLKMSRRRRCRVSLGIYGGLGARRFSEVTKISSSTSLS